MRQILGGEQPDQPVQGQAMHPEHRAARNRERAHQVVGGLLDRRDHENFAGKWLRLQPRAGGGDSAGGALRDYDFTRSWHRRGATRCRATTLSSSPRIGSRKRPRGVVSTAVATAAQYKDALRCRATVATAAQRRGEGKERRATRGPP